MTSSIKAVNLIVNPPLEIDCSKKDKFFERYVAISFVDPVDKVQERFLFEANRFLYDDVNQKIADISSQISRNINTEFQKILDDKINKYSSSKDPTYQTISEVLKQSKNEFVIDEKDQISKSLRQYKLDQEEIKSLFESYKIDHSKELESEIQKIMGEQTNTRGTKVHGVFDDYDEACKQSAYIHNNIDSTTDIFIGPVGKWFPSNPNSNAVADQEYQVKELDNLVRLKKENMKQKDEFFTKRIQQDKEINEQEHIKALKDKIKKQINEKAESRSKKL